MKATESTQTIDDWSGLFRLAGVAAFISAALVFVAGAVFMTWPPPGFEPSATNTREV